MTLKSKMIAAALLASLGIMGAGGNANAAVAGLGVAQAGKSMTEQAGNAVEQIGSRRGGFRVRHFGGHRHRWHKHRHFKYYGYYPYYYSYGGDCHWVKKWRHGHLKKIWICH